MKLSKHQMYLREERKNHFFLGVLLAVIWLLATVQPVGQQWR